MAETSHMKNDRVEALRAFNRFYTEQIGVLREGLLDSKFPLMEARVLYELAARGQTTAKDLRQALHVDPGYLSRVIRGLTTKGLVDKQTGTDDRRKSHLSLSPLGGEEYAVLEALSRAENGKLLLPLTDADQVRLVEAMNRIRGLLSRADKPNGNKDKAFILRPHRPGDMGDVIALHGRLYPAMFGWDETFEALVAKIAADFILDFDPAWDCSFIAEVDGDFRGSAFAVKVDEQICKLRLMIIDQRAHGLGLGRALLNECLRFARATGYQKMTLWTNDVQTAARGLYASAGFELVHAAPGHDFGVDLVAETWDLNL
jgi:DNA-binding MarR family transcriptional regulator/GNAT superfamily N-acetyltransferase